MKRLAAGPLGPTSTLGTRRGQKLGSAKAVIAACLTVLDDDGDPTPSIENVLAAGRGFSRSTLHRERYKPILHAAKARHAARAAGAWREGDEDALSRMEALILGGTWTSPLKGTPSDADRATGGGIEGVEGIAAIETIEGEGVFPPSRGEPDAAALAAENEVLHRLLGKRDAQLQQRDDQLYHALQTAQLWSRTIRRLRDVIAGQRREIETLQAEPWDPRTQRDWGDDDGDEEEWPENG